MLERLRDRIEEFLEALARERLQLGLSELHVSGVGARYARAADLFALDRITEVQRALAGASGAEEDRVRTLLEFLVHGRAACMSASELDQLLTWEAQASVQVEERYLSLRALAGTIRDTADPLLRARLHEARLSTLEEQAPLREGLLARQREAVVELGYGTYLESCEFLGGIDLRGVARDAERFLAETEEAYRELLAWYLPRVAGVEPADATEADLRRVESAAPLDADFPAERVWSVLSELEQSGLDPTAGGRLRVERRGTLPGATAAMCFPLRVPDEVVVVAAARRGRPNHAAVLFSVGLGLQRASVDASLPLEQRWLGDPAVPLGIGYLLEGLLDNPALLARVHRLGKAARREHRRLGALIRLIRLRRSAAELLFELGALDTPDAREIGDRYVQLLGAATGVRHDPRAALWSLEPGFPSARRVRAEQLQAVLAEHLRARFDEDWFRNPSAGDPLRSLLAPGQRYSASELAVQLTSAPLSFGPVRARLEEAVG